MKITKSEDCNNCRGCCKFEKGDEYFAPLFTRVEINKLKSVKDKSIFKSYKSSGNVFQIELVNSNNEKDVMVCPFLDEKTHLCGIYELRPFDCKFWPFVLTKSKDGNSTTLSCFDKDLCPSLESLKDEHFEEQKNKVIELINSEEYKKLVQEHPGLVWDYEKDTFLVKELN